MKKYFALLFVLVSVFLLSGCSKENKNMISNTTWTGDGGSLVEFSNDTMYWYKDSSDKKQNYYAAKYKFYIGEEAIKFVTNDLKEYGITQSKLDDVFNTNEKYSKENFVVLDFDYFEFDLDGEKQDIPESHGAWIGFLLDNNTYLDVANIRTGTYYGFSKNIK